MALIPVCSVRVVGANDEQLGAAWLRTLRPDCPSDGALRLTSPLGQFGDDGAYLTVLGENDRVWVRRTPLVEEFRVHCDEEGVLRTDHALDLLRLPALRLHYRLEPRN